MLDLLIVLAFVAYSVTVGVRARRSASTGLQNYVLAGRSVPGWKAGASMAATQFAADTPLLVTGLVATTGIFALWRLWIYAFAFLLLAFVFSALWRRSGVITDAELTEIRYSGRGTLTLRVLKAIYYSTIINCAVLAMVLIAAVRIAEVFLPWDAWLPAGLYDALRQGVGLLGFEVQSIIGGDPAVTTTNAVISVLVIVAFVAGYSVTGGLRSVIDTDVVQLAIALSGTAVYAWYAVEAAGGLGALPGRLEELYGGSADRLLSWAPPGPTALAGPFLLVIALQWFFQMNSDGTGYLAQRSIACRSDRDAQLAGLVFAWVQILLRSLLWLLIAVALLAVFPFAAEEASDPTFTAVREATFVTGIDALLPPGARGLMLTALLAALASTVDTHLNWGASYWSNDIWGRLVCGAWLKREPTSRELVAVARLSYFLILALAFAAMINLQSIQLAWSISLLFGAGMGSVLVLRWLWEGINLWSEVAAMALSLCVAPLLLAVLGTGPEHEWLRLSIIAAVTTAGAVLVTRVTPPTDDETLRAFFRRVRPAGFWPRAARLAGEEAAAPMAALGQGLAATALTAASLFALLVGLGQLLVRPEGQSIVLPLVLVILGALAIPLWWRCLLPRAGEDPEPRPELAGRPD